MDDKSFVAAFNQVETPQDVVELFQKHNIDVPFALTQELLEPLHQEESELSVDDLDSVSGGGAFGKKIGSVLEYGVYYGAGYLGGRLAGWSKKRFPILRQKVW